MISSPSRRKVLQAVPAVSIAGLSGCSGLDVGATSDDTDASCTMFDFEDEENPPLRNAKVVSRDGDPAKLRVTLVKSEVEETDARWIEVYEPELDASSPEYAIPLDVGDVQPTDLTGEEDVLYKEQAIGTMPVTGRFRVEVADEDGSVLAWKAFSYDCSRDSER